MKIKYFIPMLLGFLTACSATQIAPTISMDADNLFVKTWNLAVIDLNYEFEGEGKISINHYVSAGRNGGRVVAGLLAAELANLENIKVVERGRITKLIDEQVLQQSGAIDSKSAIQIGKLVGADAVVVGDLTDYLIWDNVGGFGSTISYSMRMIDVQSGRILLNASISRVRPFVDAFPNAQLTTRELVESILKKQIGRV